MFSININYIGVVWVASIMKQHRFNKLKVVDFNKTWSNLWTYSFIMFVQLILILYKHDCCMVAFACFNKYTNNCVLHLNHILCRELITINYLQKERHVKRAYNIILQQPLMMRNRVNSKDGVTQSLTELRMDKSNSNLVQVHWDALLPLRDCVKACNYSFI